MINVHPIIKLYKEFDRYKHNSDDEILAHIYPSLELNQYKIHKENGRIYGFSNWAFLNKSEENNLLKTNKVSQESWNSGDILWHGDIVARKNVKKIMDWTLSYYTQLLGCNKKIKYLRIHNDKIIQKEILTKGHYIK